MDTGSTGWCIVPTLLYMGDTHEGNRGTEAIVARFTRRFTPSIHQPTEWLVLIGTDCQEYWMRMNVPDEVLVRRRLCLSPDTPVLIGRP